ncbi:unnamed protein product [Caenorhabditis angaria]|uniref:Uncharacterized protein n=1 Tax=Caenorhabditis angaria TaxID=860376 RepID=A0A9P1J347_9PELO|nr:unnamed protein product [Caenorhabditis angaria]
MDYNGNSISENPFLKHDGASKRLFRRRPIVIRDSSKKVADIGFKMEENSEEVKVSTNLTDLEYGPGIVEKLRAKFSRFSGTNPQQQHHTEIEVRQTVNKRFSSFEDLLADNNSDSKQNSMKSQPLEYTRRASRSISDMVGNEEHEKPMIPVKPVSIPKSEEQDEVRSITQLRRRFEKNGDQAAKMRFARDPVELITKVNPSYVAPKYNPQPKPVTKPVSNILKILNDAESTPSEPEFVQIARRLRRFQPEVHESAPPTQIGSQKKLEFESNVKVPPPTPVENTRVPVKWHRRQPEMPNLTESAKVIRESCDIVSVLPPDPHSARVSKQPIPPITPELSRSTVSIESSPPPEEPKPTVSEQLSTFRKTVVDISSDKNSIANSVFKYEAPPTKPSFNNNFWKTDDQEKITFFGRKIEDIGSKSIITSPNSPNVVSITVKGPSRPTNLSNLVP